MATIEIVTDEPRPEQGIGVQIDDGSFGVNGSSFIATVKTGRETRCCHREDYNRALLAVLPPRGILGSCNSISIESGGNASSES